MVGAPQASSCLTKVKQRALVGWERDPIIAQGFGVRWAWFLAKKKKKKVNKKVYKIRISSSYLVT